MSAKKKQVEKKINYSLVNVVLVIDQCYEERGIYTRLISEYKLAYTDDDCLSKFTSKIKKNPLKYYKRHFAFDAPIISRVFLNPISLNNCAFGRVPLRSGYYILEERTNLTIHDLYKHNRNTLHYQPNIELL